MENLEDAARDAAARWKARDNAKEDMRIIALELIKTKTMTEAADIIGVSRTSLYYFLYGRDGKTKSAGRPNDQDIPVHDGAEQLREGA